MNKRAERLREMYPEGTRVELISMEGEDPLRMYDGLRGTVSHVDDIGQIHVNWENGSSLALDYDRDTFSKLKDDKIRVVYVEPGKYAREMQIGTELSDLQQAVGGLIGAYYPFAEAVCIVCNDEGKISGQPLNRSIRDEDGEIAEIIAGPFFICDCSGEDFGSLTDEQIERYKELFRKPEKFFINEEGKIDAKPFVPADRDR